MEGEGGQVKRLILNKCFVHEPFIECLFFFTLQMYFGLLCP